MLLIIILFRAELELAADCNMESALDCLFAICSNQRVSIKISGLILMLDCDLRLDLDSIMDKRRSDLLGTGDLTNDGGVAAQWRQNGPQVYTAQSTDTKYEG